VTSDFGWRTDPITGNPKFHAGIDIAAPQGAPVYAPQAGMVVFSGNYGGYGNVVVLSHGNSLYTVYGHNSKLMVQPGDTIYRGQLISLVGSTGRSTGPHLHFEVHYTRQYLNPVAYMLYVQQTDAMLAQASQRYASPSYGYSSTAAYSTAGYGATTSRAVAQQRQTPPVPGRGKSVNRGKANPQAVQLLNGGDEELVEF
jgi:hypothetical protein